jgi:hypothetical protein
MHSRRQPMVPSVGNDGHVGMPAVASLKAFTSHSAAWLPAAVFCFGGRRRFRGGYDAP